MKKKMLSSLLLLMSAHSFADNVPALKIVNDFQECSILLSDIDRIQYAENEMMIKMKDGDVKVFIMDEIKSMVFDNVENSTAVKAADSKSESKAAYFDLKGLPTKDASKKGVYIMKMGKETKKIAK